MSCFGTGRCDWTGASGVIKGSFRPRLGVLMLLVAGAGVVLRECTNTIAKKEISVCLFVLHECEK